MPPIAFFRDSTSIALGLAAWMRSLIRGLVKVGLLQPWAEVLVNNLLLGGQAWADSEKAKLADLDWQIIVEKPV